VMLR